MGRAKGNSLFVIIVPYTLPFTLLLSLLVTQRSQWRREEYNDGFCWNAFNAPHPLIPSVTLTEILDSPPVKANPKYSCPPPQKKKTNAIAPLYLVTSPPVDFFSFQNWLFLGLPGALKLEVCELSARSWCQIILQHGSCIFF